MARQGFDWIKYDVSLPAPLARQMRWLTTTGGAAPVAAEAPAVVETELEIPDLRPYPSPSEKARVLLEAAAEVEHALMVQYLYAGYSLKSPQEVSDAKQKAALNDGDGDHPDRSGKSWPLTLRGIAREEMGHFMTVQNLLGFLGLPPHFQREDSPPRDDNLHPFPPKLQPLTRSSLAKYVVAESPGDADDIGDIVDTASAKAGWINRVGVIYAMLGIVFARQDQIGPGATGDAQWDAIVRTYAKYAYDSAPGPEQWHLPENIFQTDTTFERQADPDDWSFGPGPAGHVRVDRISDRETALGAIHFISVQGEGPTTSDTPSHFARFLRIWNGDDERPPFPKPPPDEGSWEPARPIPTNPKVSEPRQDDDDITNPVSRNWARLADERYALLLAFLQHYLVAAGDVRQILTGWVFAEMRSWLGFIARELTSLPAKDPDAADRAAAPFTLPEHLSLPDDDAARWRLHQKTTIESWDIVWRLTRRDEPGFDTDPGRQDFLTRLINSDRARYRTMLAMEEHAELTLATSFVRDIRPLFRAKDIDHMRDPNQVGSQQRTVNLASLDEASAKAAKIKGRIKAGNMPPPPDPPWTRNQAALLQRWIDENLPP